jgi:PAS domain S-box-containing protein
MSHFAAPAGDRRGPTGTAPNPAAAPDSALWRGALTVSGGALILIGALGACAWACGAPEYLQLVQSVPPMHSNGAFGVLLWGCAHLALVRGRARAARVLAVALGALGVLVLIASVPGSGVRLDRWAFPAPPAHPFGPAGVGPGEGAAFVLTAAALILASSPTVPGAAAALGTLVGAFLVVGGPLARFAPGASDVFGRPHEPSVLGVAAGAIGGAALLTGAFRKGVPALLFGHALPLLVGLAGLTVTAALWAGSNAEQVGRINRQVQFETAHVRHVAQDRLSREVSRIDALAEQWAGPDRELVKQDVSSYVGETPACLGVARVDADGTLTWIESRRTQPKGLAEFGAADALGEAVRCGRGAVVRPPRSHWRGARVLLIFAPHRPGTGTGGLVAVLRLQELFEAFLNANVAPGYAVTVTERGEPIFARYATDQEHHGPLRQALPVRFHGCDWELALWPTEELLARENLSLPRLSLLVGLVTTALLALAVHLAQTARRRTAALENEVREREGVQRALAQSEQKYRTLIENLGQGIFLQDHTHRYVTANGRFCHGVGRTEAEIVGATDADLYDAPRAARHAAELRTVLAEGRSFESEEETVLGGRTACVRRVLTPVRDGSGRVTGVLGICWDVTEQRRLEAHVHQASKMDAIGQLAGGIAHDFNNLLTVILGNLELLGAGCPDGSADRELIAAAQGAAVRAAALTQRLLGFSRRHQLDWRPTDVNALVVEVVALLQRTIDPLIRLETELAPDLWAAHADPTQLNQVLMNLCLNARDAIAGPGRITIETARATDAEGHTPPGDYVRLRVTDTGCGMAPEVRARLYEPFFTTKEVGKGTGLGLAMVFAIVRQHKGWIECRSEVGTGTRFDVYLPRGAGARAAAADPTPVPAARPGRGTVLVADDEELIGDLAALALEGRGYRVLRAADGQQAVDAYSAERDRIDLVVLDLTMPVLSGHESFRQLLNLNPQVRVLFASGYAVEQLSELEKGLMAGFLKKPYRPNDLILAVEAALQPRPALPDAHTSTPLPALVAQHRVPAPAT